LSQHSANGDSNVGIIISSSVASSRWWAAFHSLTGSRWTMSYSFQTILDRFLIGISGLQLFVSFEMDLFFCRSSKRRRADADKRFASFRDPGHGLLALSAFDAFADFRIACDSRSSSTHRLGQLSWRLISDLLLWSHEMLRFVSPRSFSKTKGAENDGN
jgi:hypothetical protein